MATSQLHCTVKSTLLFSHRLLKMFSYWWQTVPSESHRMPHCQAILTASGTASGSMSLKTACGCSRGTQRDGFVGSGECIREVINAMSVRQTDNSLVGDLKRRTQGPFGRSGSLFLYSSADGGGVIWYKSPRLSDSQAGIREGNGE